MAWAQITTPVAVAEEVKLSGTILFEVVYHDETELAGGRTLSRDHLTGMIKDKDSGSPIHNLRQDCIGAVIFDADGTNAVGGQGSCDSVDADGDVWWMTWRINAENMSDWQITGGTGKFAGVSGGGQTTFGVDDFNMQRGFDGVGTEAAPTVADVYEGVMIFP